MDSLHLSAIAALLYFIPPGSSGTKSHPIPSDTSHHSGCRLDGNFIMNCSFTGISALPEDITPAVLTADLSHNNIKILPRGIGRDQEWMLKHLNLSNNLISELSFARTFSNLPYLETLNLNGNAISTLSLGRLHASKEDGEAPRLLPALEVLAVERNSLETIPEGLGMLQSLQTVHLSSNAILQIDVNDFQNCSHLKNIYLQDNKITKIHPEAFKDLNNLQVVDLCGNALTTLPPQISNNWNIFQLGVDSPNNPYVCNCNLDTFKHLIHFLFDSTRKRWSISRNPSVNIFWKPLMPYASFNLNCNDSVSFKTTLIPMGKTSVLNCNLDDTRGNGVSWWTPIGRISRDMSIPHMTLDKMNNLVIHNVNRTVEGFYMCIFTTTRKKYLIYNIQVKEKPSTSLVRQTRSTNTAFRQEATGQDLVLPICLSVFITFAFAFCLGAFARPYLGKLWRLMHRNKNSASEDVYSNEDFSNAALGRECTASIPTNTRSNSLIGEEISLKGTHIFPTETSSLHKGVIYSNVQATSSGAEYQKQCTNESRAKQKPVFSNNRATTIGNEHYINVNPNTQSSVGMYCRNSNEVTPQQLTRQDISLHADSNYTNSKDLERSSIAPTAGSLSTHLYSNHLQSPDSDLPFRGDTALPFSGIQTHTNTQGPGNTETTNKSHLLQFEITEATADSPQWKDVISNNGISAVLPRAQNCNEELGINDNKEKISDAGKFILPNSFQKYINHENLSAYPASHKSLTEHYKRGGTTEQEDLADLFGDSSSDEGVPFTMSDCSSASDLELGQPPSSSLPGCQSSPEKADANKHTGRASTAPEPSSPAAEHWHTGEDENTDQDDPKTTARYELDTTLSPTESPYTNTYQDHVTESDSDTIAFSYQNVPDMFKSSTHPESTIQNSISVSTHKQNTSSNDALASSKCSPTYTLHAEGGTAATEADLSLSWFSAKAQHFQSFRPTEQEENAGEASAESTEKSSSEEDNGDKDVTLRRSMRRTSEKDHFTFAPTDFGSHLVVTKTALLSSNTAINESALQSRPHSPSEGCVTITTERSSRGNQGKQVRIPNTQNVQKVFNKSKHDEYPETWGSASCNLPEEMQSCTVTADSRHPNCSGKTPSVFSTESYSHLDQSEENAYSSSPAQRPFNENIQYSLWSFPQTGEKTASRMTDSSDTEDDTTLTPPENYLTTAVNLKNSSEKLDQKNKPDLNQGQFFVKKKRAFDGFANVLQSRTNFNS